MWRSGAAPRARPTATTPARPAPGWAWPSRGLVEAHHGRIAARNHGAGCRFEVHLPLVTNS
jgi:hypothetical protein